MMTSFPRLRVSGPPYGRGHSYGSQAAERIQTSIRAYRAVFAREAGWAWDRVTAEARAYLPAITAFDERYVDEMNGIADGAGVALDDILAINTRTEVMFGAVAAQAARTFGRGECSAFAVLPDADPGGQMIMGQNWDWLVHCVDTVVIVDAEQDDGPDYVTVVEAGLLAKTGMNESGLGLATNALVTADDRGDPLVPYHVILRGILDAPTLSDALAVLQRAPRASSANFLLAHRDGVALSVEAAPGGPDRVYFVEPQDGCLLHTNHFLADRFDRTDLSVWSMPDSPVRLQRLRREVQLARPTLDLDLFRRLLADHANHPSGICSHPDPRWAPAQQDATIASVLMDLTDRQLWVAAGHPCQAAYERYDYGHWG